MIMQMRIILCLIFLSPVFLYAQSITVKGTVVDFRTSEPLSGVSISAKGTVITTVTNQDGAFSLPGVPENATIVFSFLGRETQEIPLNGRTTLTIEMRESASTLMKSLLSGTVHKRNGMSPGPLHRSRLKIWKQIPEQRSIQPCRAGCLGCRS